MKIKKKTQTQLSSVKPAQAHNLLTPASETGKKFIQWFGNHGWDHIEKSCDKGWRTISEYPLSPREIWDKHQDPNIIIGLRFGQKTKTLTLDLDRGSAYHPWNDPKKYQEIIYSLEEIGLCRHVIIQSSFSEGIHIIYPLPEEVPTFKAACLVQMVLIKAGLEVKSGQLEIFPNPKRYSKNENKSLYNGIRIPLQPNSGSYLLDEDINIKSERIEDLLEEMERCAQAQDIEKFKSLLDKAYEEYKSEKNSWKESRSEKAKIWKENLQKIVETGWTGHSQTNYLLIKIVTYAIVFCKFKGQELKEKVRQMAINAPGYEQYCNHQHEIEKRIEEICNHTEKKEYYLEYLNFPKRSNNFNEIYNMERGEKNETSSRQKDTKERLEKTVNELEAEGKLPKSIAKRREEIQKKAKELFDKGFSNNTFSKSEYFSIWHPKKRVAMENEKNFQEEQPETPDIQGFKSISLENEKNLQEEQPETPDTQGFASIFLENEKNLQEEQPETPDIQGFASMASLYEVFESGSVVPNFQKTTTTSSPNFCTTDLSGDMDSTIQGQDESLAIEEINLISQERSPEESPELSNQNSIQEGPNKFLEMLSKSPLYPAYIKFKASKENLPKEPETTFSIPQEGSPEESVQILLDQLQAKKDPPISTKEAFLQKCEEHGVELNSTIKKLVAANSIEDLNNALEILQKSQQNGKKITNPAGFLASALKDKWQSPKSPESFSPFTEEFLIWYKKAISAGAVQNVPIQWLSLYQNWEPMVRVNRPTDLGVPYTLMRWTEARDELGDF